MRLWILLKPSVLIDIFWQWPGNGKGTRLLLLSGGRNSGFLFGLYQHLVLVVPARQEWGWPVTLGDGSSPYSPLGLLWHHHAGRGRGLSVLSSRGEHPGFLLGHHGHWRGALVPAAWEESHGSLLGFLWHHPITDPEYCVMPLWGWKSRLSPLACEGRGGATLFSVEFD